MWYCRSKALKAGLLIIVYVQPCLFMYVRSKRSCTALSPAELSKNSSTIPQSFAEAAGPRYTKAAGSCLLKMETAKNGTSVLHPQHCFSELQSQVVSWQINRFTSHLITRLLNSTWMKLRGSEVLYLKLNAHIRFLALLKPVLMCFCVQLSPCWTSVVIKAH